MEILRDQEGRYRVTFNGTLMIGCENDFHCPDDLVCVRNQTWTIDPAICLCPLTLGRTGMDCRGQNVSAWILITISLVVVVASSMALIGNLMSLVQINFVPELKVSIRRSSALFTTIVLTTIASAAILCQGIYQVLSHFLRRDLPLELRGLPLSKQSILIHFNLASSAIAWFFAIAAALNISLVLIEIAERVRKGSNVIRINVYVYRRFLLGYVLVFGVLLALFTGLGRVELSYVVAAPGVFFIAISYFIGWYKLSILFQAHDTKQNGGNFEKVRSTLSRVRATALGISCCAAGMIVNGILQVALDGLNRPDGSYAAIPGRVFWVFAAATMDVLTIYTRQQVTGRATNSQKQSGENNNRAIDHAQPPHSDTSS